MLSNRQGELILDRAAVEKDAPDESSPDHHAAIDMNTRMSKRERLSGKVKSILHVHDDQLNVADDEKCVTLAASPNATSAETRLDEGTPPGPGPQGFKQLVRHPVDTLKAKADRKTNKEVAANLLSPEVTHAQDVELIRAQDTLNIAETDEEKLQACENLETLKQARQDLYIRWTMDRHVLKLKRLASNQGQVRRPKKTGPQMKTGNEYLGWPDYGQQLVLQQAEKYAGQYIGFFSEPPPASQETVSASIERLLVASTPWQEFIMHVRRIYRWENQKETSAYLVAFIVLWTYGALCAFACLALIGQVIRRRFKKLSVEKLRQDIKRTEDSLSTAHTLTEQIEKRGAQSWVDPLIEDMGEWLLLQLGDMANLLEVLLNFYEWRQPIRTAWTLVWLGSGCLGFYLTPVWLLVKAISLLQGLTFFALFPIASRYPKYRLLASPVKWLFWNIPTHAEWAIARLQVQGRSQSDKDTGDADVSNRVHGTYTCSSGGHAGRLAVTSRGVRFESFGASRHQWEVAFMLMSRVEKVNSIAQLGSGKDLLFFDTTDVAYSASNVAKRDEVFTQIVGYSNVKWQVVG